MSCPIIYLFEIRKVHFTQRPLYLRIRIRPYQNADNIIIPDGFCIAKFIKYYMYE